MVPNLTPAVGRAMQAAQECARVLGALHVRPAHLLQALLREEEGRAAALLQGAGLDLAAYLQACARPPVTAAPQPGDTPLPLSPDAQSILDRAQEFAADSSAERTVASEHLVLALAGSFGLLRQELEEHGLRSPQLEAELAAIRGPELRLDEPLQLDEITERVDLGRILDAGANRAREALRVLEDYARFVLDDALLTGELKRLRHDLVETLADLPPDLLQEARETSRDVGTALSTAQEVARHSLLAVVQANGKRLQEAFRSLEEYGKVFSPNLGQALEQLRYRSYTVERALFVGTGARDRLASVQLCVLVSAAACAAALDWTIQEAAAGGAGMVQLREKDLPDRELLARARQVRRWTRQAGVLFIMNDRPDLARLAEADGVHLGQEDMPVREARRVIGPGALIGVSTHDNAQVCQAILDGASYLGAGPAFPSGTKQFPQFPGLDFVREVAAGTSLPAFVIGGITLENLGAAVLAGARRVAVCQAICQADDPRAAAGGLVRILQARTPS